MQPDFPDGLRRLIHQCLPNVDAVELLLMLAREPHQTFALGAVVAKLSTPGLSERLAQKYLASLEACGLIAQQDGCYRFAPQNPHQAEWVNALDRLYSKRPVTLIRAIYALRGT
jgi:hypothetical protein